MMRMAWPADTVGDMQARLASIDPGVVVDAGLGIAAAALTAIAVSGPPDRPGLIGTPIAGPAWLLGLLPVLFGAPLLLRRRAPLLMWTAIWATVVLLYLVTDGRPVSSVAFGPYPETPQPIIFVLFAAAYSLGAHARPRRAAAGLVVAAPIAIGIGHHGGLGLAFHSDGGANGAALALLQIVAFWLAGVLVRARRRAVALAASHAALQNQAQQAVADERARIARELHDIVAHHLSVVVLHAAGARAAGGADLATLEEIEDSGRRALTETRRLFGVLRDPDLQTGRAPQPGIGELPALAANLRAAGLEVSLTIDGSYGVLPSAVDVSAYRIVQEALTNVLKHAGPARAEVTVDCSGGAVTIEVTDDGPGAPAPLAPLALSGGQGLAGMRERVAVFGGELRAAPRPEGGFSVLARLPIGEPS
jgi:signal transduction histidine kinase